MPRLTADGNFGPLTMARVMEVQFLFGFPTAVTDGVVGRATQGRIDACHARASSPSGQVIVVDLIRGRLRAFRNGVLAHDFTPVSGGMLDHPTARGVFSVYMARRYHTSTLYPYPPGNMDFSLYFNGNQALHQGPAAIPSHGCVHVEPSQAEMLFRWAGGTDESDGTSVNNVRVIILKTTP